MEGAGWETTVQMALIAISTWYIRSGSKHDSEKVVKGTAAQSTSNEILNDVKDLKAEVAILKKIAAANSIDHRSPKGE